mmetsp:Transcript_46059/g.75413  ORF Transcript_46059/g.75413 Transcript_46059/m.75413 type:complete len:243 (-) Transcript_46059:622-1350(-)
MLAIGRIPSQIIPSRVLANEGNTSPGQSHRVTMSSRMSVWKCLVLPGVALTTTFLLVNRALMVLLFPTLGYPTIPTTRPCFLGTTTPLGVNPFNGPFLLGSTGSGSASGALSSPRYPAYKWQNWMRSSRVKMCVGSTGRPSGPSSTASRGFTSSVCTSLSASSCVISPSSRASATASSSFVRCFSASTSSRTIPALKNRNRVCVRAKYFAQAARCLLDSRSALLSSRMNCLGLSSTFLCFLM